MTHSAEPHEYTEGQIQQLLTEDPAIAEQGITAMWRGDTLLLCGEVESVERRRQIESLVAERFPEVRIDNDISITKIREPDGVEELS